MSKRLWTNEEDVALRNLYADVGTQKISEQLKRSMSSVYQRARILGLTKSDAFFRSEQSGRLTKLTAGGVKHRFQKGSEPWNKGMKGLQIGGEETQFKSGFMPHNTKPIGSYRYDKDGTLQRKVSDAKGSNSKRWRGVHELVWTEVHGPVPVNHIVVFKPGMRTAQLEEIALDRVECISFSENMRRNTVHRLPKEIAELCQLRGALNRQINKRASK